MYSESAAMTGYADDASTTFDVRIARVPETGKASLWFYVFSGGIQLALVADSVQSPGGATRIELADASFSVSGSATASLSGSNRQTPEMAGRLTARGHLHQTADPDPGAGDTLVQIEAQLSASHTPIRVRPGRIEVMGRVQGQLRIENSVRPFDLHGKWHEQTGDRPSFAPAFTYLFLQGTQVGLMTTRHERGAWGYLLTDGSTEKVIGLQIEPYGQAVRSFVATLENGENISGTARIVREVSVPIEGRRRPGATVLVESDLGNLVGVLNDWQPDS